MPVVSISHLFPRVHCVSVQQQKTGENKKSHTKSAASFSPEQIRRQLQHHLSASLRAERAARRHGASSSDSPPPPSHTSTQQRKGCKPRSLQENSPAEKSVRDTAPPGLLSDGCLTGSVPPAVHIERAERGAGHVEESSEGGSDTAAQLRGADCRGSSEPGVASSRALVGKNSPGKRSLMAQHCSNVELTPTSSVGHAGVSQDPPKPSIRDMTESPSKCTASAPGRVTPSKVLTQEKRERKDPATLVLPGPSQTEQNIPSCLQPVSSPQGREEETVVDGLDVDSEQRVTDTCQASLQTAQPGEKGKRSSWKKSRKTMYKKRKSGEQKRNNMMRDETSDQCITRSQSFVCKRMTRSTLAQSRCLKRTCLSLEQQVLNWSLVKRRKRSEGGDQKMTPCEKSPVSKSHLQQYESRPVKKRRKRGGKAHHFRFYQESLKAGKHGTSSSDGNNNCSDEAEESHQPSDPGNSKQPGRITRSGLNNCHLDPEISDSKDSSDLLLLSDIDWPQGLPVPDQGSRGMQSPRKVQTHAQAASRSGAASLGTMASSQVRYGGLSVQITAQGSSPRRLAGGGTAAGFVSGPNTLLFTEAEELQSGSSSVMPVSLTGGSIHGDGFSLSPSILSAIQCHQNRHPSADMFLSVQGKSLAEVEALSYSPLLDRRKHHHLLANGKRKRGSPVKLRSLHNGSAESPVRPQKEGALDEAASVQDSNGLASSSQWDVDLWASSSAVLESVPPIPDGGRSQALVPVPALQASLSQSPDQPDQILLWSVPSQEKRLAACQSYPAVGLKAVVHTQPEQYSVFLTVSSCDVSVSRQFFGVEPQ
ncbi:hypothetical protein ACOMHN_039279 [Nucella lapillus]